MILRVVATRILLALLTLFLVSIIIFAIVEVLPGDVASRILGRSATPESLAVLRAQLHLDVPAPERYVLWLGNIAHGNFGEAVTNHRPVSQILAPRIRATLTLSLAAFVIYIPLSLFLSIVQAINKDRGVDHVVSVATLILVSIPDFLLSTLLIIAFCVFIPLLPVSSTVSATTGVEGWLRALVLPAVVLATVMAVYATRMLRDSLIEVLGSDYVRMAELKGLPFWKSLLRHALPNALIPVFNVTALNFSYLMGGVVIVEKVFGFPGFGSLMVDGLQLRDAPIIEATVLISATIYILANLIADIGAILVNPRLREA